MEINLNLYVSPNGNDAWSGRLAEPDDAGADGPFATIEKARDTVRSLNAAGSIGGAVTVWLRGGTYFRAVPLEFGPQDSGPVTYRAYPGEYPLIDGGVRIGGWRNESHHGREVWVTEVAADMCDFRQLWVDGRRRPRARYPKVGSARPEFFHVESVRAAPRPDAPDGGLFEGTDNFIAAEGDLADWAGIVGAEIVLLHFWVEERMPIVSFDAATRVVKSSHRTVFIVKPGDRYYIENLREALTEPGEWYLDNETGKLYYLPMPGEAPETCEVVAPRALHLLNIEGHPEAGEYVEGLKFQGLTFQHSDWRQPEGGWDEAAAGTLDAKVSYAAAPQACCHVPGALRLLCARHCSFEDCKLQHLGFHAIEIGAGCTGIDVIGNDFLDIGGGALKIGGASADGNRALHTGRNIITDNHICGAGRVFHGSAAIFLRHSFGNEIAHNHIHDVFYSGISSGWVWGYTENISRDNRIEKNHIHDLGHGWLSDMGGIYTLGVQPGTTIRGNLIHDIEKAVYGGWAIYPDEGSSHLIIENNVCYNTSTPPFHQHYGRENMVRNNIFAFGREAQIALSRAEDHLSFTFERNIVITRDEPIFTGGYLANLATRPFRSDLNLFWSVEGTPALAQEKNLADWRALGYDTHSVVSNPGCRDLDARDFTLDEGSPAFALGFEPIELSDVGPRPRGPRE